MNLSTPRGGMRRRKLTSAHQSLLMMIVSAGLAGCPKSADRSAASTGEPGSPTGTIPALSVSPREQAGAPPEHAGTAGVPDAGVGTTGVSSVGAAPVKVVRTVSRSALEAVVQEQLKQAEAEVAGQPQDVERVGRLAMLYHAYGLMPEAAGMYERAERLATGDFRWPYLRAQVSIEFDDRAAAEKSLRRARELKPDYVPASVWLGRTLLMLADPEEALRVLQPVRDAHPDNDIVAYTLGLAYLEVNEPVWALEYLKPVMERNPGLGAVHAAVVRTFSMLGQPEKAESLRANQPPNDLSPTLRDPELVAIYHETLGTEAEKRRAMAYAAAGDGARALEHYSKALEFSPDDVETRAERAELLLQLGDLERADEDLRRVLKQDPNHGPALLRMAQLHLLRGENAQAEEFIQRARRIWPENPTVQAVTARLATLRGDHEAAAEALAKAVASDPNNAGMYTELGAARWQAGDTEGAIAAFRNAVRVDEAFLPALKGLADAYLATGSASSADTWYVRAYAAGAADPMTCFRVTAQYIRDEDYEHAEQSLKRGLAGAPDDPMLNDALARFYSLCPYSVYRNGAEAVRIAHKVYGEDVEQVPVHGLMTLAAAYAEVDDFAEAVRFAELAVERTRLAGETKEAERLNTFLTLYRQGRRVYEIGL